MCGVAVPDGEGSQAAQAAEKAPPQSTLFDEMLASQMQVAASQPLAKKAKPTLPPALGQEAEGTPLPSSVFDPMQEDGEGFARRLEGPLPTPPTPEALSRITADLRELLRSRSYAGMFVVVPERKDITKVHSLLFGPKDTPYEWGFFHFHSRFPSQYPWQPPIVILRTTDNNQVRFGPNLYADGKVCLSILGTWSGPRWTPVQTLTSVLLSILSLLNPVPYHNEPGYERAEKSPGDSAAYNLIIAHETLRVAVVGEMLHPTWPVECDAKFLPPVRERFLANFEAMRAQCQKHSSSLDGTYMMDPFGSDRGRFDWKSIQVQLERIKKQMDDETWLVDRRKN